MCTYSRTDSFSRACACALAALVLLCAGRPCPAQDWSPDGRQIAVGGPSLALADVSALLSNAGQPAPNTPAGTPPPPPAIAPLAGTGQSAFPAWSPDGKTLAYLADGQKLRLFDLATQKSTVMDAAAVTPVSWAPDSKSFAVVRRAENGGLQMRIYYRTGGTALTVDLPFPSLPAVHLQSIAWVPNTDNVVLVGGEGQRADLYLVDQGQVERLTSNTGDVLGFTVSADGERVLWVRRSRNARYIIFSLYELALSSRKLRKLDYPAVLPAVNPHPRRAVEAVLTAVFAPDRSHFAFVTRGGPEAGPNGVALYVSDLTGKEVRLLGRGQTLAAAKPNAAAPSAPDAAPPAPTGPDLTGLTFPMTLPAFSPDSKQLAAIRFEEGKRALEIIDIATGQARSAPLP
ncbi:MAG TPA: LpqB family beta-propeller domain-containing protein [Chthonomonadaceae bacterium]|nr:LpqB family beta-propeller domain-containing protein [Chthonomonadaceae bacterium]